MKKAFATALLVLVMGASSSFAIDTIVPTKHAPGHVTWTQTIHNMWNKLFGYWEGK